MRLENLLALTNAKLLNEPFVKEFSDIVFEAKRVKRGDLFIAFDTSTIDEAVRNGAYGVVFDKNTEIIDDEIAWIRVEFLDDALRRLLRFRLIEKDITVYECGEITLKLALQLVTESNFITLNGDIKTIYHLLWDLEEASTLLFSPSITSKDIFTDIKPFPKKGSGDTITIIEQTLFETSFIYDNTYYERQLISPFFIPYLEELFSFLQRNNIEYRLKKFTPIDHFEPVFTNKKFEVKEFGTSDKVLIFEKNSALIEKEISFLQQQASWAKIVYIIPYDLLSNIENDDNLLPYRNKQEILNILREQNFHFALVVGVTKDILLQPLKLPAQNPSLFDFSS